MARPSIVGEGKQYAVKLGLREGAWIEYLAKEQGIGIAEFFRHTLLDRLYLFNIPFSFQERIAAEAESRNISISTLLADHLAQWAMTLPDKKPKHTPIPLASSPEHHKK